MSLLNVIRGEADPMQVLLLLLFLLLRVVLLPFAVLWARGMRPVYRNRLEVDQILVMRPDG